MKKTLLLFFVLLFTWNLSAQVKNKGYLKITGGNVIIKGLDFQNQAGATLEHTGGSLYFSGTHWTNDGNMVLPPASSTAQTVFNASADQVIEGSNENFFNHLVIQQPASSTSSVTQTNDVTANQMTVEANAGSYEYKVNNGTGQRLTVKNQLTLNGNLKLYEDSQLLQESNTAVAGSGKLFRDQSGTGNKYWYNYWSAPVNQGGVWQAQYLLDARHVDPTQNIVFEYAYTGSGSSNVNGSQNPAHINEAWIYVFRNAPDGDYSSWTYVGSTGNINPAEGYTMKGPNIFNAARPGSSSNTEFKGYTFSGKPNNGTYSITIDHGNDYLVGNPYPSALDVNDFINENSGKFSGTLYFWEHVNGSSHYLNDYTGGYAVRNLLGGVPAKDWQTQSTTVGTKTPGRYVPVAQGFFLYNNTGSTQTISFNNTQRDFVKEDGNNSVFMRSGGGDIDIHLKFVDPRGGERKLLLGVRDQTTFGEDWGWDALVFEGVWYGDMYFDINGKHYVIQGIPEITETTRIPLYVELTEDGTVSFGLYDVVNAPSDLEIYLEDAWQNTTNRLDIGVDYSMFLNSGHYPGRFFLTFSRSTTKVDEVQLTGVNVNHHNDALIIFNHNGLHVDKVRIFNLAGQLVYDFHPGTKDNKIILPAKLSMGTYIAEITSDRKTSRIKFIVD